MEDNMTGEQKLLSILGATVIVVGGLLAGYGCQVVEGNETEQLRVIAQYGDADALENVSLDKGTP